MACGKSTKEHGVVMHVDHIKPRSKHPELSLCFDNLQVLCEDCNIGKGNRYDEDYRPSLSVMGETRLASLSFDELRELRDRIENMLKYDD